MNTQDTTLTKDQLMDWARLELEHALAEEAQASRKRLEAHMQVEQLGGLIDFNNEDELRRIYAEHLKSSGPLAGCEFSPVSVRQRAERLIAGCEYHNKKVSEFETFARENSFLAVDIQQAFRRIEASEAGLFEDNDKYESEGIKIKNFLQERRAEFAARADRLERERARFEEAAAVMENELGEVTAKYGPQVEKAIKGIRKPGKK